VSRRVVVQQQQGRGRRNITGADGVHIFLSFSRPRVHTYPFILSHLMMQKEEINWISALAMLLDAQFPK